MIKNLNEQTNLESPFCLSNRLGKWQWISYSSNSDAGLNAKTGTMATKPNSGTNPLIAHGLLKMSPGKRNVVHAAGTPFLMYDNKPTKAVANKPIISCCNLF